MSGGEFSITVRVYLEDTDAGGAVYHASYLRFMERARSEWLRQLAPDVSASSFVVRRLQLRYRRPALLADSLRVLLRMAVRGGACITLWQGILRGDELLCDGRVELVSVDSQLRVCRLSGVLCEAIADWQGAGGAAG